MHCHPQPISAVTTGSSRELSQMNSMLMNKDIISNWEARHELLFGNEILKLQHRLMETGMFTREAVGKLIERCPERELGLESMSDDINNPSRLYGILGD